MSFVQHRTLSRRGFCLCCVAVAGCTATGGWLSPSRAYAEARNTVDLIRDDAAKAPIQVHKLRRDVSILEGSGGNIAVLTGADGKVFIDAGITVSRIRILEAANSLSSDPIRHLINTHWHFDHADGNTWLNAEGAVIIAHENTPKHLLVAQRVEDWDYTFPSSPLAAVPTEVFSSDMTVDLNGSKLALKHYAPAHTDSDISVTFPEADILHCGDTYWNGIYPFIDYSNRREHRRDDQGGRGECCRRNGRDDCHPRPWPAGEQQNGANRISQHARGDTRQRREAQAAGPVA